MIDEEKADLFALTAGQEIPHCMRALVGLYVTIQPNPTENPGCKTDGERAAFLLGGMVALALCTFRGDNEKAHRVVNDLIEQRRRANN